MQNQNHAKQLAKQLMIDLAKSIPPQQRQNLLNLFIEVDRLEQRLQILESENKMPTSQHPSLHSPYPSKWAQRTSLRPHYTKPFHPKN